MTDFGKQRSEALSTKILSQDQKAAAVLLAMGRDVAGKLLKYFTQGELQNIITAAQTLRTIPADELLKIVNEFEDLFTEGAGLMDNAAAIEDILEAGLTPEEVDGLLGRRPVFDSYQATIWDRLQDADPTFVGRFLAHEHPQTIAYMLSQMPSGFGARVLLGLPEALRADAINRAVNLKSVNPKAARIIENRIHALADAIEAEHNAAGSTKVAEVMNELDKSEVDTLLTSLETVSKEAVNKVRPKIFLFDDILQMPHRSRVMLLNDIDTEVLTTALRGAGADIRECILTSISPRQRRMVENDLAVPPANLNPREIAVARRTVAREAIRLATSGQIALKEETAGEGAAQAA